MGWDFYDFWLKLIFFSCWKLRRIKLNCNCDNNLISSSSLPSPNHPTLCLTIVISLMCIWCQILAFSSAISFLCCVRIILVGWSVCLFVHHRSLKYVDFSLVDNVCLMISTRWLYSNWSLALQLLIVPSNPLSNPYFLKLSEGLQFVHNHNNSIFIVWLVFILWLLYSL